MLEYILSTDSTLGRIDFTSLSQQTLMELMMNDCKEKHLFQDDEGYFLDVEHWNGVTHNDSRDVCAIHWNNVFKDPGNVDFFYLPSTVENFYAEDNSLWGHLDCTRLPELAEYFSIANNFLDGTVELACLPGNLATLDLGENKFIGTIDLTNLNPKMVSLELQRNKFQGTVDLLSLPPTLEHLSLRGNNFCGSLDFSRLPASFRIGKLENNDFSGDVIVHPQSSELMLINLTENEVQRVIDQDGNEQPIHRIWM